MVKRFYIFYEVKPHTCSKEARARNVMRNIAMDFEQVEADWPASIFKPEACWDEPHIAHCLTGSLMGGSESFEVCAGSVEGETTFQPFHSPEATGN